MLDGLLPYRVKDIPFVSCHNTVRILILLLVCYNFMTLDHLYTTSPLSCQLDIYHSGQQLLERRRDVHENGNDGNLYELSSPDGIRFGYYNVQSSEGGEVRINNIHPFLQLSYAVSGTKSYTIEDGTKAFATFQQQQYNYLFFKEDNIRLTWEPNKHLEIFELGISPELFARWLPQDHPFYPVFIRSVENNESSAMSKYNLPLAPKFSNILYDILHCPLENRYKQLYIKAKVVELLSYQLEHYEQYAGERMNNPVKQLRKEEIERMYQARDIIVNNLNSPCSLIDLASQVGTNENYLKSHFKTVFGNTVFGYLSEIKMNQAKDMLLEGKSVSEVSAMTGYKHIPHFSRAFKKHFGFSPNVLTRNKNHRGEA